MPGDSSRALAPRAFVLAGPWPDAALAEHHGVRVAQALARRLAGAMRERGLSANRLAASAWRAARATDWLCGRRSAS